jgi:hypothetical protein
MNFHLRLWSWLKGGLPQGYMQFDVECDLMRYESKVETIVGFHLQNLLSESNFKGV